jgi:antitoxin (DNA-binding transcriptional repressor) of toxin-antitoxin stability system
MTNVTMQEAQAKLPELIHELPPGTELVITENGRPVATLVASGPAIRKQRQLGTLKGTVLFMAPDFDAPLDDFKEYMQ